MKIKTFDVTGFGGGYEAETQKMIWNYIDGLPRETLDHTVRLVKPLATIDDLRKDDSHEEDSKLNEKD